MTKVRFRLKKGDTVKVLAGRDRGKTGKIIKVYPKKRRVTVEGLNLLTRFQRPRRSGEKGQRVRLPAPLPASRVMLVCANCGKPTRIGVRFEESGRKVRICKKCGKDT